MTDPVDEQGRRASAAVHARSSRLPPDEGVDEVMRRGRRPRLAASAAAAAVVIALVGAPLAWWVLGPGEEPVELTDQPADGVEAPAPEAPAPEDAPPDEDEPAAEPEPEPDPPAEEPPEEEQADLDPLGAFDTDAVTGELPPGDTIALLSDVRVGGHDGFDRIVLEFEDDGTSPYEVGYVEPPILSAGKGEEVDVEGAAFLEVRLFSSSGADFAEQPYRLTYEGPERVTGETSAVTEVVRTGDFEATLSWVVGLPSEQPFTVEVLEDPLRLVVDVQTRR